MDGTRFDQWTKRLIGSTKTRRSLLRLGVGGGLAALSFGTVAHEALACRRTGKPCGSGRNGNCCSGTCKRGKCRPTPGAAGCKVSQDACKGQGVTCPNNPEGVCIILDNGKPFCHERGACQQCTSNASCTDFPNGKCLKTCMFCEPDSGGEACVYPQVVV